MKAFEYRFQKDDYSENAIFDTFCFYPENIYEKKLGNLHMVGFLKNALPQDRSFLANLAKKIKENHYASKSKNIEKALNESLQKANQYLDSTVKQGNVGWMGNLNFAVLGFKEHEFHFTKCGDIKIYLLREGGVIDIEKDLEFPELEPYPVRVFGNLVSGALEQNDAILALTSQTDAFFRQKGLLNDIASLVSPLNPSTIKSLKETELDSLVRSKKEEMENASGSMLIVSMRSDIKQNEVGDFDLAANLKKHSLRELFKVRSSVSEGFNVPKLKITAAGALSTAKVLMLVLLLAGVIGGGFLVLKNEQEKKKNTILLELETVKSGIQIARQRMQEGNNEEARSILSKNLNDLADLNANFGTSSAKPKQEISDLSEEIEAEIKKIDLVEVIEGAQLVYDSGSQSVKPEKMIALSDKIVLFDPENKELVYIDENKEGKTYPYEENLSLGCQWGEGSMFLIGSNALVYFKDGDFSQKITLKDPYAGFLPEEMACYGDNVYFFDPAAEKIIKYPNLGGISFGEPQSWLADPQEKISGVISMDFDKNGWFLKKDQSIVQYYTGELKENFSLEGKYGISQLTKIATNTSCEYLVLLDKQNNRVVILDKTGILVKQLESPEISSVKDLALLQDGKSILVLSQSKVWRIEL